MGSGQCTDRAWDLRPVRFLKEQSQPGNLQTHEEREVEAWV